MQTYWKASLSPAYNFFLSIALLVGYEGIFRLTGGASAERNLVDQWITRLLSWASPYEWVISVAVVLMGLAYVYVIRKERTALTEWVFLLMLAEAAAWGFFLYKFLPLWADRLRQAAPAQIAALSPDFWRGVAQCMGAGFYEELFFRVLLVEGMLWIITGLRRSRVTALHQVSVWVLSAALFSLAHFLYEPPTGYAFLYRFLFGLFMSGIYILRGFGITAWAHALYDMYVLI